MSLPMMTFSLRPRSSSTLPSRAASVSTLVVSWNEAAERKLSVASEALVMPRMISSHLAGSPPAATACCVLLVEDQPVDHAPGQEARVARGLDEDLLGHLADDELHVLVVDLHALLVVDLLHLAHDVAGGLEGSPVLEQLVRVERALVELVARLHLLAVLDHEVGPAADGVAVQLFAGIVEDDDLLGLVGLLDVHGPGELGDLGLPLGLAGLEQLDYARQTVSDVGAGDPAGVEGTHGELGTRLTDGLRGDVADRLADGDQVVGGQRTAVAELAHADLALAAEHRPDLQLEVGVSAADRARAASGAMRLLSSSLRS